MPKASPRSRDSTQRQSHCVSDVFGGAVVSDILEAETALCRFAPLLGLRDGSQANAGVEDQTAKLKPCTPLGVARAEHPWRQVVSSQPRRSGRPRMALFLAACLAVASFTVLVASNLASNGKQPDYKKSGPAWPPNAIGRAYG
jgi:hypothetical protein